MSTRVVFQGRNHFPLLSSMEIIPMEEKKWKMIAPTYPTQVHRISIAKL